MGALDGKTDIIIDAAYLDLNFSDLVNGIIPNRKKIIKGKKLNLKNYNRLALDFFKKERI